VRLDVIARTIGERELVAVAADRETDGTLDVALVGSYPPPHGGQSVHIRNLAMYLVGQGLKVRVLNMGSNKRIAEDGVVNIESSWALFKTLLRGPRYKAIHVHVSGPDDYGKLVPVAAAAAATMTRWFATVHSGNIVERVTASRSRRALTRALLRRAHRIVVVNRSILDGLRQFVGGERMAIIPPFSVNVSQLKVSADLESFFAEHAPVITCVGQFDPVYGFEDAVRLMTEVRRRHARAGLLLIGDARHAGACQSLIADLSLGACVKVCGNRDYDECLAAINRAAVFLRPTLYDGDSMSVREALALGTPVVATATDFRPEGAILYRRDVTGDLTAKIEIALSRGRGVAQWHTGEENLRSVETLYDLSTVGQSCFQTAP
jgi:glycogen synthase